MKYFLTIFLCISLIIFFPVTVSATEVTESAETVTDAPQNTIANEYWPQGPDIQSASAVVMEIESGTIVYEKASTEAHFPASITKVMTSLVALENSSLDEIVTFSKNAVYGIEPGSSSISRDVDEQMTMEECLYALLLESANEVGNAIAEHIAGSNEAFAEMMNAKAKELGCVNTHFVNPHGLHDDEHYTCAYDMALISRAAYQNPSFAVITGTKSYQIPPTNKHADPTPLNNHHAMLHYYRTNQYIYPYCVGGKTGYTSKALSTLVTYAKKEDFTLVAVVMCVPGSGHYQDTTALMDYYLDKMQTIKVSSLTQQVSDLAGSRISSLTDSEEVPFEIDENAVIFVPKTVDQSLLNAEFSGLKPEEGSNVLGELLFEYGGKQVGSSLVVGQEVEVYPFKSLLKNDETVPDNQKPILINIYLVLLIAGAALAGILIIRFVVVRANSAVSDIRRRRFENRDPHKNMRRIRRRRRKRSRREKD